MQVEKWNDSWKFWEDQDSFALVWNIPQDAVQIELPHDAMISQPAKPDSVNGGNTGFRDAQVYTYVKMLYAPDEYRTRTVMLKFEGVYMNAFVYVNGEMAAKNPFGYTTFYVELNDFLKYGQENEIRVQVRAGAMTNSRWYSGAGIYRDVYLLESALTYLVPEGVQVHTEHADEKLAVLMVKTELKNRQSCRAGLVLETSVQGQKGHVLAAQKSRLVLLESEKRCVSQRITVANPKLWSDKTPDLYTVVSRIYSEDGALLDESRDTFGIRTLALDAKRGFQVNGTTVKLRGACIHADNGLLGSAVYEDAHFRQVKLLKDAGFNALRMSHHPAAPALLKACDALGMYVMDETFDMWNRLKSNYDYGLYFQEWWEKDVEAMVRKDYNRPSVILYSIGNEIPEIGTNHGAKICHQIAEKIKALDPTRYTLASINGVFAAGDQVDTIVKDVVAQLSEAGSIEGNVNDFMTLMDGHMDEIVQHRAVGERLEMACAATDIAGYNYMTARYEPDGEAYPGRVIVGSETYPPEIARNWELVERLAHVIGDFTWTGWDYIGEAGVGIPAYAWGEGGFGAAYPAQLAYTGDLDITGFRRPASYFRQIVFGLRTEPYIAVQNPSRYGQHLIKTPWVISDAAASWTYSGCEGQPVIVEVYAPGSETELLKNGVSLGRKPSGKKAGFRTLFETTYEPGTLAAVAYENGREIGRTQLVTAKAQRSLALSCEGRIETGSAQQLYYVQVCIQDEDGVAATDCDQKLTLHVEGGADAVGFGSGDPKPSYTFSEGVTKTFGGRALIILKKNGKENSAKVVVEAENGMQAEIVVAFA
ncbi:MAG: DUF4982 domain-containing protein [Eubacterium sp.]|nr:DUF4982 domain-containing protein [Eubacterium sp.]